jgi:phospholipase/carboxylesterase
LRNSIFRRRQVLLMSTLLSSCASAGQGDGTLTARPRQGGKSPVAEPGTHALGLRSKRDALLYVPKTAVAKDLVLYLHGAGGSEEQGTRRFGALAEKLGFVLLSPASEGRTWDAIRDGFGPDLAMIDAALHKARERVPIDRVVVAGFSDGASYALSLGLRNPGFFHAIAAFSPGFIAGGAGPQTSKTRVFVSHGTEDEILPIESCSRRLVPALKRDRHTVNYREFAGPHTVPAEIAEEGLRWALKR